MNTKKSANKMHMRTKVLLTTFAVDMEQTKWKESVCVPTKEGKCEFGTIHI